MRHREEWSVESTIGLAFTIVTIVIVAMVLAVIGLTAYAVTNPTPEQTIVQKVETTGDVRRLYIEARTNNRIDAMSCELIDPQSGGVMR